MADTFDADFKAEVIAAEMIDNNVSAEQIMILMLGSRKRSFRKDVDSVTEEISDYNNKEYTLITTHKEGIYDMLPEGLFHSPTLPKNATTQKEIIDNIKKHRIEESNARRLFLPFEAAINHLRIQMALFESRLDKGAHHNDLVNLFKNYWEIFKYLDTDQSDIFLQVLPLIHDIRDDYESAAIIFELLLSLPVKIEGNLQGQLKAVNPVFSSLNDTQLGINFTTGNAVYDGGEDEIVVTVGPLSNEQLKLFSPGSRKSKILEMLSDYLLPVHVDINTDFELFDTEKGMSLADTENDFNATLGLSTYL
ncbi:MAG: type VI secretion system baseplate subunit TssG [Chitinophagaceae bacterium]|nr:type VI secretion system baseplate subunit TssG [Chitinophagaceae bacterium]